MDRGKRRVCIETNSSPKGGAASRASRGSAAALRSATCTSLEPRPRQSTTGGADLIERPSGPSRWSSHPRLVVFPPPSRRERLSLDAAGARPHSGSGATSRRHGHRDDTGRRRPLVAVVMVEASREEGGATPPTARQCRPRAKPKMKRRRARRLEQQEPPDRMGRQSQVESLGHVWELGNWRYQSASIARRKHHVGRSSPTPAALDRPPCMRDGGRWRGCALWLVYREAGAPAWVQSARARGCLGAL